ncbi:Uncharacterised protein [Mycobacteroides abscessus subsp. abscessus]|nr:Uncharacterised protein [Mycobacteroides abscessus subsp. abscessus]
MGPLIARFPASPGGRSCHWPSSSILTALTCW